MKKADLEFLRAWQQRCDQALERQLGSLTTVSPRLQEAMSYGLMGKGKRIRPVLSYAGATSVGELSDAVDAVACAVECIHAYSLVHDDLPSMDDDDLRRGLPTCHVAFDEATAILAGDALHSLAFQILARIQLPRSDDSLALIDRLAEAAGASGMVAGQALDLAAVARELTLPELEQMHRYKTGALIRASVSMGALATGVATAEQLAALDRYGDCIGLAFQVQDDILDVAGTTEEIGKQQGADALRGKPTYVSLLGIDKARQKAREFHEAALDALSQFDQRADPLRRLSTYIVERSS